MAFDVNKNGEISEDEFYALLDEKPPQNNELDQMTGGKKTGR